MWRYGVSPSSLEVDPDDKCRQKGRGGRERGGEEEATARGIELADPRFPGLHIICNCNGLDRFGKTVTRYKYNGFSGLFVTFVIVCIGILLPCQIPAKKSANSEKFRQHFVNI